MGGLPQNLTYRQYANMSELNRHSTCLTKYTDWYKITKAYYKRGCTSVTNDLQVTDPLCVSSNIYKLTITKVTSPL